MSFYIILIKKFLENKNLREYSASRTDSLVVIKFVYPYLILIFLVSLGENCVFLECNYKVLCRKILVLAMENFRHLWLFEVVCFLVVRFFVVGILCLFFFLLFGWFSCVWLFGLAGFLRGEKF